MQFVDEGYIIGIRKHGENSAILTVLCKDHGKVCGYAKSCFSKKNMAMLQVGNLVKLDAWSRVDENMLSLKLELISPCAVNFLSSSAKLQTLSSFCALANVCLPELQPLEKLYDCVADFINLIGEENWLMHYCIYEFYLLEFLGVGIDLSKCAVSGKKENLAYISPKTARAVSYSVGLNYADKLFKFPKFIVDKKSLPSLDELIDMLQMTAFFLNKNFFTIHGLKFPISRASLTTSLQQCKDL